MAYSKLSRNSDQRKALLRDLVTDIIIQLEGLLKEDVPSFVKSLKKVRQVLPPSDESVPIFRQKNPGIKSSNTAKPQKVIVDNNTLME